MVTRSRKIKGHEKSEVRTRKRSAKGLAFDEMMAGDVKQPTPKRTAHSKSEKQKSKTTVSRKIVFNQDVEPEEPKTQKQTGNE